MHQDYTPEIPSGVTSEDLDVELEELIIQLRKLKESETGRAREREGHVFT